MKQVKNQLKQLYKDWAKEESLSLTPIAQSGSSRKYFRITGKEKSALGVFNSDKRENKAFISLTKHFTKIGLNVPQLYRQKLNENIYLLEDLGNTSLYSIIDKRNRNSTISKRVTKLYEDTLTHLIRFQIEGGKGLDYSVCYPRPKFDKQSILWDLNYFKYYFVRLANIPFDEQKLEDDFNSFTKLLLSADLKEFM